MTKEWIIATASFCVGLFFLVSAFLYGFFNITWWNDSCHNGCSMREFVVFLFHAVGIFAGLGAAGAILEAINEKKTLQDQQLKHKV